MAGQLIFQLPTFHWPSEDQQTAFKEWQSHVTLVLEASNIPQERWYASIIGFLGSEGFKQWQHLDISKDVEQRKTLENVFTTFSNTLEVLTSQWNYIDEMYSNAIITCNTTDTNRHIISWCQKYWTIQNFYKDI